MNRPLSAAQEWKAHWPVVLAASAGMSVMSLPAYSLGVFMPYLEKAFGWSRTEASSGMIMLVIAVPVAPLVGHLVDRWGTRRIAILGVICSALCVSTFSLATPSLALWAVLWGMSALLGQLASPTVWAAAVSGLFDRGRALAISAAVSGIGITSTFAPPLTRGLIDLAGWRGAYALLGLGWGAVALALVVLLFFDARTTPKKKSMSGSAARTAANDSRLPLEGLTVGQAFKSRAFLSLLIIQVLYTSQATALSVHLVPILVGAGYDVARAAGIAAALGLAAVAGKLFTGWLLDRTRGPLAAAALSTSLGGASVLLLHAAASTWIAIFGAACVGLAGGVNLAASNYLLTRYVGLRAFGKNAGILAAAVALAASFGSLEAGMIFDHAHSYVPLLLTSLPVTLLCVVLYASLGPYRWSRSEGATRTPAPVRAEAR